MAYVARDCSFFVDDNKALVKGEYEGIVVQQWEGANDTKTDMCVMYFHPHGMLGATPVILLGEEVVLEVKTLPTVAKKGITLEEYIRDNECPQDFLLSRKNGSNSLKNTHQHYHQIPGQMYLIGRKLCTTVYWIPAHILYFDIQFDKTWSETIIQKLINFYKT